MTRLQATVARAREWHRVQGGRWTYHSAMSFATTTENGHFTRFGRIYWPLRDRVKSSYLRCQR